MRRLPVLTIGVAMVLGICGWCGARLQAFTSTLWYDRGSIIDGDIWRLLTGHIVHHSWSHLVLNLMAFVVLGAVTETSLNTTKFARLLLVLGFGCSAGLMLFVPSLDYYAGISAINYGLLCWLLLTMRERFGSLKAGYFEINITDIAIVLLILRGVLQWQQQQTFGQLSTADLTYIVAWQAHFISMAIAAAVYLSKRVWSFEKQRLSYERE